ncbi:MAG: GNAT family protein [Candidatus Zixiibacteriota bacterium]
MKKKINNEEYPTAPGLIGNQVYLRPTSPEDFKITYQWFLTSDPFSQTSHQIRLATPSQVVERMRGKEATINEGDFIIASVEDHRPLGKIRYFNLNMLNRSAELGYIVAPSERQNGYAQEGLKLIIGFLFNQLNLNKVYAQTATFNKPSIKLLESLDFKLDGTLRQHHFFKGDMYDDLVYSLLKFECSF